MISPGAAPAKVQWQRWIGPVAGLVILALALVALRAIAREVDIADVVAAVHATPTTTLIAAGVFTVLSYVVLTGYDWLALEHLGYRLPYRQVANAAFVSYTMSHTLGLTALTGGTVRYRFYTRAGVKALDVVLIVALCGWTFWLGVVMLAGIGLVVDPAVATPSDHLSPVANGAVGLLLLVSAGGYSLFASLYRRPLRLWQMRFTLPDGRSTLKQLVLGALDLGLAAAALYILLPADDLPPFPAFLTVYAVAMILGALSHAPGGLGVFEAVVLVMLPRAPKEDVLAALFLFRVIYTLIPFAAGLLLLAVTELRAWRARTHSATLPP